MEWKPSTERAKFCNEQFKQKSFKQRYASVTWTCLEPYIALLNSMHSWNIYTKSIHLKVWLYQKRSEWAKERCSDTAILGGCAESSEISAEFLVMPWLGTTGCLSTLEFWKRRKKQRSFTLRIGALKCFFTPRATLPQFVLPHAFFTPRATLPQFATETHYPIASDALETLTANTGTGLNNDTDINTRSKTSKFTPTPGPISARLRPDVCELVGLWS